MLTYTRNTPTDAIDCSSAPGARVPCSAHGTKFTFGPAILRATNTTSGISTDINVGAAGNYIACLAAGNYTTKVGFRDGRQVLNAGEQDLTGPASIALRGATLNTEVYSNVGGTHTVPSGGSKVFNFNFSTGTFASLRANMYMLAQLLKNVWLNTYGASSILCPTSGDCFRTRIQDRTGAAGGNGYCFGTGSTSKCVHDVGLQFGVSGTGVLFHEMGHGIDAVTTIRARGFARMIDSGSVDCNGAANPHSGNASSALGEGLANWIEALTMYSPTTVPTFPYGQQCNSYKYPPTGSQPAAFACGSNAIPTDEYAVSKALIDLVDANTVANAAGCRNEQVQVSPLQVLLGLQAFTANATIPPGQPCSGLKGIEEGGVNEGSVCAASTPNWPYQGGQTLETISQSGLLDLLGKLKTAGINGTALRDIWANSGWQPADSAVQLP